MSWCSASGIFATCGDRTKDITMKFARTYRGNKDAPASRAVQAVGRIVADPHLGVCKINTSGFDFR